jgi:hypothetical protein
MQAPSPPHRPNARRAAALLAAFAASFACSASPAPADVPIAQAPISIDHCSVDEAAAIENPKAGPHTSFADGIVIGYTNERDATATEVRFAVKYAGKTLSFADRGTFAAHAKVSREFTKFTAVYNGSKVECRVLSATFADGTRWDAPETVPTPAASP